MAGYQADKMYLSFDDVELSHAAQTVDNTAREIAPAHDSEILIQPKLEEFSFSITVGLGPKIIPIIVVEDGVKRLMIVSEAWLNLMFMFGYFSLDDTE